MTTSSRHRNNCQWINFGRNFSILIIQFMRRYFLLLLRCCFSGALWRCLKSVKDFPWILCFVSILSFHSLSPSLDAFESHCTIASFVTFKYAKVFRTIFSFFRLLNSLVTGDWAQNYLISNGCVCRQKHNKFCPICAVNRSDFFPFSLGWWIKTGRKNLTSESIENLSTISIFRRVFFSLGRSLFYRFFLASSRTNIPLATLFSYHVTKGTQMFSIMGDVKRRHRESIELISFELNRSTDAVIAAEAATGN